MTSRTARTRIAMIVLACGVVATGAACSDDKSSDKPLSKADYIEQADKICQTQEDDSEAKLKEITGHSEKDLDKVKALVVETLESEVSQLRELNPPAADRETLDKLYTSLETAISKIKKAPGLDLKNVDKTLSDASDQAKAYGFKVCGGTD